MAKISRQKTFEDYEGFVEKFKPKKTTDDCYTPPAVYDAVVEWVDENIQPLAGLTVRRPFKPGGDYECEAEEYGPQDVVVDNPPFSILARIIDFYVRNGVRFFLFAPALTLFSAPREGVTYIATSATVIYENGADVRTSFVTNMEGRHRVIVAGDLCRKLDAINKERKTQRKLVHPDCLITGATLGRLTTRGITLRVPMEECAFVRSAGGTQLFGGGFLLSARMAAERMAAERMAAERMAAEMAAAARLELTEEERRLQASLGK